MTTYFGGCALVEHDEDEESRDHKVVKGWWEPATCTESDQAKFGTQTIVWSSLTDMDGEYGEPRIFTQWGSSDERVPVVADLRYIDSPKTCEHMVYRIA